MKIGDLVVPKDEFVNFVPVAKSGGPAVGIVIGKDCNEPVVYWNEQFPSEIEYREQLRVISG